MRFLDYELFTGELTNSILLNNKCIVNTINQYSYCMAENDGEFKKALVNSDILLPDGVGITVAARLIYGKKVKKIAGADIHKFLLQSLQETGGSCFYLGSADATLSKIKEKLSIDYPAVKVGTYSPPYKAIFSSEDNKKMTEAVNIFKPDVLFVGMTAPKQEKWVDDNKHFADAKVICSIGAVFDFYAGTVTRPNKFWIKLGLEWFIRLLKEPKRMSKRYLYYGPLFIYMIIKEKFKSWA